MSTKRFWRSASVSGRFCPYLKEPLGHDDQEYTAWARHFMGEALAAIEGHRDAETGVFSHGSQPTLADACLVSQEVGCSYFGGATDAFPVVNGIYLACMDIDAFQRAHPLQQPEPPRA
jgi:maleylpyruvate isomerase